MPHFAAAIYAKDDGVAGLLELKRLAECLLAGGFGASHAVRRLYEHPRRSGDIYHGDALVGRLFEFHPSMVETGRAAALDLDLSAMEKFEASPVSYQPVRRFPTSAFDLSVIAPPRTLIGDVEHRLRELAGPALVSISFVREFTLPDGSRSLSYRLTAGAADRTLSSEEVGAMRAAIIDGMRAAGFDLKV